MRTIEAAEPLQQITILYMGDQSAGSNQDPMPSGVTVRYSRQMDPDFLPDLILVDLPAMAKNDLSKAGQWPKELMQILSQKPSRPKPGLFLLMDQLPDPDRVNRLYSSGYDGIFTLPVFWEAIRQKARIFAARRELSQELSASKLKLEKSFAYLDRFKKELQGVKKELIAEKTSLNNALKQIHHMTRERRHLKQQLQQARRAQQKGRDGYAGLLSTLIRTRIEDNRGHQDRVGHIAAFVAQQMGVDEKQLEDLGKAAMLHEVGLLFMPATGGDGHLETEFEKDIKVQYPVKGADLLDQCGGFEKPARIIRYLNENADGTGYPDGLKKRHIPLLSRILAGADVMDTLKDDAAVTSLETLFEALEAVSGSRLDPAVVSWLEKYAVLHGGTDDYRVKGVGVEHLEPGMKLGCALFTASGTKLFSANTLLTREAIDKIIRYNREYPVDETVYIKA